MEQQVQEQKTQVQENRKNGQDQTVAILGGGNIGQAVARGMVKSGRYSYDQIIITRRNSYFLQDLEEEGFRTTTNNREAVTQAEIVIIAVQPQQLVTLLQDIREDLDPSRHTLMSIVTAVNISEILRHLEKNIPVVRVMPNTAIAIQESMTCLAAHPGAEEAIDLAKSVFDTLGEVVVINEEQMTPATALCACGIAFFLRSIRAASQGGIEIGFHAEEALAMAAQTAKGAAALLLQSEGPDGHPEGQIDKVTTPRGCTIGGLNRMEHEGFSSAMIKGIVASADLAAGLYDDQSEAD